MLMYKYSKSSYKLTFNSSDFFISVMLTLLIGILTVLVPSGIYYLIDIKNTDVYLLVVSIIFILFNLIAYKILNGFGREKIKNIN